MGDGTLDTLVLKLEADSSQMRAEMSRTSGQVDKDAKKMAGSIGAVDKAMGALGATAALAGAAILGAAAAIAIAVEHAFEAIDVTAKMQDRLDLTSGEYAALALAADLAGVSIDQVAKASTILRRQMDAASKGNQEALDAFKALGVSARELANVPIDEAMGKIADRLYSLDSAAERTALSMQLLGRGSGELDAFLRDGSKGIAEAREQVEAMGGAISRLDMSHVEEANDSWTSMKAIIQRVVDELAVQLAPAVNDVLQSLITLSLDGIKNIGGIKRAVSEVLIATYTWADGWVRTSQTIGGVMGNLVTLLKAAWDAVGAAAKETWGAIAYAVDSTIEGIVHKLGSMIKDVGGDIAQVNAKAGASITGMGKDVYDSVNYFSAGSKDRLAGLTKTSEAAGQAVKAAWTGIFTVDNSGSKQLQDWIKSLQDSVSTPPKAEPLSITKGAGVETDTGMSPENKKLEDDKKARLEIIRKSLLDEQTLETEAYLEKQEFLNSLESDQFVVASDRQVMLEKLKQDHEAKITDIEARAQADRAKLAKMTLKQQLDGASTFFSNMTSLMNTNSKRLFEIGKAAAYATTIVNTAQAAMAGYAQGMSQGGPWVAAAYAAAAVVAGAVQLANISSASPSGGGSVHAGGGAGVPSSGGGNPNSPNVGVQQAGQAQDVNLHVSGLGSQFIAGIVDEINRMNPNGVVIRQVTAN